MRVKFEKGQQKKFLQEVLTNIKCPSLRSLRERGFEVNYQTLKSYFNENRTLPEELFLDLCQIAKISPEKLKVKKVGENWGQVLGGKR